MAEIDSVKTRTKDEGKRKPEHTNHLLLETKCRGCWPVTLNRSEIRNPTMEDLHPARNQVTMNPESVEDCNPKTCLGITEKGEVFILPHRFRGDSARLRRTAFRRGPSQNGYFLVPGIRRIGNWNNRKPDCSWDCAGMGTKTESGGLANNYIIS